MRWSWLILLCITLGSCTQRESMHNYKRDVTLWYDAFNTKDPALADSILSEDWVDTPPAPGSRADGMA